MTNMKNNKGYLRKIVGLYNEILNCNLSTANLDFVAYVLEDTTKKVVYNRFSTQSRKRLNERSEGRYNPSITSGFVYNLKKAGWITKDEDGVLCLPPTLEEVVYMVNNNGWKPSEVSDEALLLLEMAYRAEELRDLYETKKG